MKKMGFAFLFLGLLSSRLSSAASFEYVTEETRAQLAREFAQGHDPQPTDILKKWKCDMFGMRTRLQVERDVTLYDFKLSQDKISNSGNHAIHEYVKDNGCLLGKAKSLTDRVKITSSGKLIAELTANTPEPLLVAYSVCQPD